MKEIILKHLPERYSIVEGADRVAEEFADLIPLISPSEGATTPLTYRHDLRAEIDTKDGIQGYQLEIWNTETHDLVDEAFIPLHELNPLPF